MYFMLDVVRASGYYSISRDGHWMKELWKEPSSKHRIHTASYTALIKRRYCKCTYVADNI